MTVGIAYEYLDAGDAEINQEGGPLQGPLKGDDDTNAIHFFAVNLIWKYPGYSISPLCQDSCHLQRTRAIVEVAAATGKKSPRHGGRCGMGCR